MDPAATVLESDTLHGTPKRRRGWAAEIYATLRLFLGSGSSMPYPPQWIANIIIILITPLGTRSVDICSLWFPSPYLSANNRPVRWHGCAISLDRRDGVIDFWVWLAWLNWPNKLSQPVMMNIDCRSFGIAAEFNSRTVLCSRPHAAWLHGIQIR